MRISVITVLISVMTVLIISVISILISVMTAAWESPTLGMAMELLEGAAAVGGAPHTPHLPNMACAPHTPHLPSMADTHASHAQPS